MKNTWKYIILLLITVFVWGCAATKYVPKGKSLLTRAQVSIDDKRVSQNEAKVYLKQKPNSKMFGLIPFYLGVYNLSGRDSTKRINKFLREWGEAPVVYDSVQTQRTVVQLKRFMENKGFYKSVVKVVKKSKKRKLRIKYQITANKPKIIAHTYRSRDSLPYKLIGNKNFSVELLDSTSIRQQFIAEGKNAKIRVGDLLDVDRLRAERERMEMLYKTSGYYNFNKDNVFCYLDTTDLENKVNLYYGLRSEDTLKLRKYKIRVIKVYLDIDAGVQTRQVPLKELLYSGLQFFYEKKMMYKPDVLSKAIAIKKGSYYNLKKVEETKERLGDLQQFRYINVSFKEIPTKDNSGLLDCFIQLASRKRQSYGVELMGTVNSGDLGYASHLRYQHNNLFRGAELFSVELSAGREKVTGVDGQKKFSTQEFGGIVKLVSPKFLLPFLKAENWRARKPRTSFSVLYNYAERPEYRRTITDLTFSYRWKNKEHITHVFTPVDLGILKVTADATFLSRLNSYYRKTSYVDHIIPSMRYSFRYNNQGKTRKATYQRFRFNVELSGNLLNSIDRLVSRESNNKDIAQREYYSYFGIRYAQYLRSDVEFTYNQYINSKHALIYHTFLGAGFPYGNSKVLPFEKMYFVGGPNSMRSWQPRSLGPGASKQNPPNYRLSYGEMRLEGNVEYRFGLGKNLEGALFVDAGNVWNLSDVSSGDDEGKFYFDTFYKQIAVGTGLGLRLDISNIILRFDAGIKVIDPYLKSNTFVPREKSYKFRDITFNFGIGYPF